MTREEAIDVLKHNYPSACFMDLCEAVEIAIQALSAQPEIIRCIECRWGREPCGGNIECFVDANVPPEYHGYDWFCPNGERRTEE